MTIPGGRHARPAPGEHAEDQGHEQKARGQEDHLALDRGFHEGLIDHHRPDDTKIDVGKSFFRLRGDRSGEFGDLGHRLQQALLRQFDGDVDDADIAFPGQDAARDTRVGRSDGTDLRPRLGPAQLLRVDKIPHIQIVAVGGRVLEIGERVDAPRIGRLPGGFRQPDRGRERVLRRGIAVVGNDQEDQVLVLPVCVLQRFQRQELWIVVVEEDAVAGRELEQGDAARSARDRDQRDCDDQPAGRQYPLGETLRKILSRCPDQAICLLTSSRNTPSTSMSSPKEPLWTTFPACNT